MGAHSLISGPLQPRDEGALGVDQRKIGDNGSFVAAFDVDPRLRDGGAWLLEPDLAEIDRR